VQLEQTIGATFTTQRRRPAIVAVVATLVFLALAPRGDFEQYKNLRYLPGYLVVNVLCLICLFLAVRGWKRALRRPIELRLTPTGLTVKRGDQELAVPWNAVSQVRIDGDSRRPWLVAWLDPNLTSADVPATRRGDGGYKVFPIAHGLSVKKRQKQVGELRAALMGFGRRYLDSDY
jgi:hypothetical protein